MKIGDKYISRSRPDLRSKPATITDISECGQFIQFHCGYCNLTHEVDIKEFNRRLIPEVVNGIQAPNK